MAPVPEHVRLSELASYGVVDTAPEAVFDDLVQAAADVAGCPTALVSLLDEDRQWFKARCGLDVGETPRDQAFCEHALRADAPLIVPDATLDPRFATNPLVTGPLGIRFYAGFPLRTRSGAVLGTLCVLGYAPRPEGLTPVQHRLLSVLATQVMTQLDLRRSVAQQAEALDELEIALSSYRALADGASDVVSRHDLRGATLYVSPSVGRVLGYDVDDEVGRSVLGRVHPDDRRAAAVAAAEVLGGATSTAEVRTRHADGSWRHLEIRLSPVRDDTGGIVQIHSAARDVTERHEAQQRLQQSEERYRVLFEANPVGQVELSPDGVVQRVNGALHRPRRAGRAGAGGPSRGLAVRHRRRGSAGGGARPGRPAGIGAAHRAHAGAPGRRRRRARRDGRGRTGPRGPGRRGVSSTWPTSPSATAPTGAWPSWPPTCRPRTTRPFGGRP